MGTPQYMAPEQASGHLGEIDERTDQFSLAAMAYELVTGEPAFSGKAPAAILYQVVHEAPSPFRLPLAATEAVILRGMAKNKAQRFPSMREFHKALVEAAAADPWPPVPVNPTLVVEPRVEAKATESESREPTAILPGKGTTLSKAARPLTVEPADKGQNRIWFVPALAVVAVAGVAIAGASLWPRGERPATTPALAPVAQQLAPLPTPPPALDASVPAARIVVPAPAAPQTPPTAKPAAQAVEESNPPVRKRSGGKKKLKIRNEDL